MEIEEFTLKYVLNFNDKTEALLVLTILKEKVEGLESANKHL